MRITFLSSLLVATYLSGAYCLPVVSSWAPKTPGAEKPTVSVNVNHQKQSIINSMLVKGHLVKHPKRFDKYNAVLEKNYETEVEANGQNGLTISIRLKGANSPGLIIYTSNQKKYPLGNNDFVEARPAMEVYFGKRDLVSWPDKRDPERVDIEDLLAAAWFNSQTQGYLGIGRKIQYFYSETGSKFGGPGSSIMRDWYNKSYEEKEKIGYIYGFDKEKRFGDYNYFVEPIHLAVNRHKDIFGNKVPFRMDLHHSSKYETVVRLEDADWVNKGAETVKSGGKIKHKTGVTARIGFSKFYHVE